MSLELPFLFVLMKDVHLPQHGAGGAHPVLRIHLQLPGRGGRQLIKKIPYLRFPRRGGGQTPLPLIFILQKVVKTI